MYPKKYSCITCNYNTCDLKDYKKHLNTIKHINRNDEKNTKNKNICECGKTYISLSGLWKHKQKCDIHRQKNTNINKDHSTNTLDILLKIVEQNNECKEVILQQNKKIIELLKNNQK